MKFKVDCKRGWLAGYKLSQCKMNCIFVVNALLLLRLTGANLVGNFTANATVIIDSVDNVSSSDPVHPYCLNTVINSPSIFDLHTDLGTAIDMLELVCTNTTFKRNVSNKIVTAFKYTYHNCVLVYVCMQPPFRDVKLELDKNEHNQNDAINAALEYHMAVNSKMETICKDEEKKFYRGESSMIEKCNISCITANVERRIVLYVSVRAS